MKGLWGGISGIIEGNEEPLQRAKIEVFEETGIKSKSLKVICVSNEIVIDAHFVTIGIIYEDFEGQPKVMEPDEITEWRWFPINDLPKPMFFPSVKIINNFLEKQFYKN